MQSEEGVEWSEEGCVSEEVEGEVWCRLRAREMGKRSWDGACCGWWRETGQERWSNDTVGVRAMGAGFG